MAQLSGDWQQTSAQKIPVIFFSSNRAKLPRASIALTRMPRAATENLEEQKQESLRCLLYRYFFFQWLFFDMTRVRGPIERRSAWLYNQSQRRWLPLYMRRWSMLSTVGFALGAIGEQALAAPVFAACWYTGSLTCVSVLVVIATAWIFLGRDQSL